MSAKKTDFSTDELEAAFDGMGEAVVIINTRGIVVRANGVALKMLGYRTTEFIGQLFYKKVKALTADHRIIESGSRPTVKAILSGQSVYDYIYYQGKNKAPMPVFVSASPIIKNGQMIGAIDIFRDISMEEAVDQMKSEFISLASHQLRTPLSSIKTYSHLILDGYMGPVDEQIRLALRVIVSATDRMNELISTLLSISRMESGTIVLRKDNVDIAKTALEVINDIAVIAGSKGVEVKLEAKDKEPVLIRSDRPIVKEIIANLVSNAVKYSMDNGLVIVAVKPQAAYVTISVSDNGLGIPAQSQAQIFSKFFRAHNVIEQETNGTGLGLYLVKGLVEQLGGRISFTSEQDKETVFKVKLPRKIVVKE